jgi:hypothetical protein
MRHLHDLRWFRFVSILSCFSLAYTASASGINAGILSMMSWMLALQQQKRMIPMFSDEPTEIYLGPNPARGEETRGGLPMTVKVV